MAHGEFLRAETHDDVLVYHVQRDWTQAPLEADERAMLGYAEKLNRAPASIVEEDVAALRAAGFDGRGVLDIVLIVSLFNFMNRLADGLGLCPDEKFVKGRERGDARTREQMQSTQAAARS